MRDPTWAGALTEVPRLLGVSLMCARPVFSHRPERAAVALGGSLLRRPTQVLPWACGTVSKTFMLHALIFFGAHAALLVVVLLVG